MAPRYEKPQDYIDHAKSNPPSITPPKDGAVYWTNGHRGARRDAIAYCEAETDAQRPAEMMDGDPETGKHGSDIGNKAEADKLWTNTDPKTRDFNQRAARADGLDPAIEKEHGARMTFDGLSRESAARAEGRVEVFVGKNGKIHKDSTFARVERDTLINNEKVTRINGVDRQELKQIHDDKSLSKEERTRQINEKIEGGAKTRDQRIAARTSADKSLSRFDRHKDAKGTPDAPNRSTKWDRSKPNVSMSKDTKSKSK